MLAETRKKHTSCNRKFFPGFSWDTGWGNSFFLLTLFLKKTCDIEKLITHSDQIGGKRADKRYMEPQANTVPV